MACYQYRVCELQRMNNTCNICIINIYHFTVQISYNTYTQRNSKMSWMEWKIHKRSVSAASLMSLMDWQCTSCLVFPSVLQSYSRRTTVDVRLFLGWVWVPLQQNLEVVDCLEYRLWFCSSHAYHHVLHEILLSLHVRCWHGPCPHAKHHQTQRIWNVSDPCFYCYLKKSNKIFMQMSYYIQSLNSHLRVKLIIIFVTNLTVRYWFLHCVP